MLAHKIVEYADRLGILAPGREGAQREDLCVPDWFSLELLCRVRMVSESGQSVPKSRKDGV
jgi:hypothetical protein